jgi:N-acetylglucosaminyl-diphospho-decaprenol L-rhamnosyltransferase
VGETICSQTVGETDPADVAVVIVTHNSAAWIRGCLRSLFARLGGLVANVVVVDAESRDGTTEIVAAEFPDVDVRRCQNRGFGYANNRGLESWEARYVLFLNPDTEILDGTIRELVDALDRRPEVGLVGVRQLNGEGEVDPTIRRFPHALRALGDALGAERVPGRPRWLGEREVELALYDREVECDWTSGSFMLARGDALARSGLFDERFFLYSEETDLCRRIKAAGWEVRHLPSMTIRHHGADVALPPSLERLQVVSRLAYARKHFSPPHRAVHFAAIALGLALRSIYPGRGDAARRRAAARAALGTLLGRSPAPPVPPSAGDPVAELERSAARA